MDEKTKDDFKKKSSATSEIPDELQNFKKICSSRCNICNSGILVKIHKWRKDGANFDRIVERAKDECGIQISTASLSRHFKGYLAFKLEMATQIIKNDVIEEITSQSIHIKRTVKILDLVYDKIEAKLKANTLGVDIGDLEKLLKMRYQVLNGENSDDKDILAIFQKASNDYGLNLQQGVLFK